MPSKREVRFYLGNTGRTIMYGYDEHGELQGIFALPWLKPYLFSSYKEAYKVAIEHGLIVRSWPGTIRENHPDMNK